MMRVVVSSENFWPEDCGELATYLIHKVVSIHRFFRVEVYIGTWEPKVQISFNFGLPL